MVSEKNRQLKVTEPSDENARVYELIKENLPNRKPRVKLISEDREDIRSLQEKILFSPLSLFNFLANLDKDDCLLAFESLDHDRLWEQISICDDFGVDQIADAAKEALGEENLRRLSILLVHLDSDCLKGKSGHEIKIRLLAGIRLASALPLAKMGSIFCEYCNIGRFEEHFYQSGLGAELLDFLNAGSYTFAKRVYEEKQLIPEDLETASQIITDLTVFAKSERYWICSNDEDNRRNIASYMRIARMRLLEVKSREVIDKLDGLMSSLGFSFDPQENKYISRSN